MRRLHRPEAPRCLKKYRHGCHNWGHVTGDDKGEIWASLNIMQENRCAYCESDIRTNVGDSNAHIEHFRQRSRYQQGTFEWSNLFGSCNRADSCGGHKDKQSYDYNDLIKMDQEDPDHYLRFIGDGQVLAAEGLSAVCERKANETIRIFNLNGSLRQIRETHVIGYLQTAKEIAEMALEFEESEWLPFLEEELQAIAGQPFETAIRHVLQFS